MLRYGAVTTGTLGIAGVHSGRRDGIVTKQGEFEAPSSLSLGIVGTGRAAGGEPGRRGSLVLGVLSTARFTHNLTDYVQLFGC